MRHRHPLPSQEMLQALIRYEPETGNLFWLFRDQSLCSDERHWRRWNTSYAGKPAFAYLASTGYYRGQLLGHPFPAHRVIWVMMTGDVPEEVDHINGDPLDNRWCNLRSVDRAENAKNQKIYASNKSGFAGVSWDKPAGKWRAQIAVGSSRKRFLGSFVEIEDAVAARRAAENELGYSKNHGRKRA